MPCRFIFLTKSGAVDDGAADGVVEVVQVTGVLPAGAGAERGFFGAEMDRKAHARAGGGVGAAAVDGEAVVNRWAVRQWTVDGGESVDG